MMAAWCFLGYYLLRPETKRPYGTLIREVDLMRQIAEAQEDLEELEVKKR